MKKFEWNDIDIVLLDMDGTLLDLYFDNYFWNDYMPKHWAEQQGISHEEAIDTLLSWYKKEKGTLQWYCLDYWTDRLGFDVMQLKEDIEHLIQPRPYAKEFLQFLVDKNKEVVMITNAHPDLLKMKCKITQIDEYFDRLISSHDLGYAKEQQDFWYALSEHKPFDKQRTLFVDDNVQVLNAAKEYGLQNLWCIEEPDSRSGKQDCADYYAVDCYSKII